MKTNRERILLVENDPDVSDLIARQTLQAIGYSVEIATTATAALQQVTRFNPDLVLANLNLPGLSGKDLLVAFNAQGLTAPIIVIAARGMDSDIIQAFRLGASDYLAWPAREAEIVSAVERVLQQVRARREKDQLAAELKKTNAELQQRVRELTTIFAIGKAVTSITQTQDLFEKIVEGALFVSEADAGWLLLREDRTETWILQAQRNLPKAIVERVHSPWEDGLSSLVALSGETLLISGEALKKFKISQLGQAALVAPLKLKKEVMGLLVVLRKANRPFTPGQKALLEAVSDYAAISLMNARLFRALEERAATLQQTAQVSQSSLHQLQSELGASILAVRKQLQTFAAGELNAAQKGALRDALEKLDALSTRLKGAPPTRS